MSKNRINKRNKIKRTSAYRGYNHYRSYRTNSQGNAGLGKAVALSFAVVVAATVIIFCCSIYVPKLIDVSKKTFISEESSKSSVVSKIEVSKEESKEESSKQEVSKKEESKIESSKAENSKEETSTQDDNGYLDNDVFIYKNVGYSLFKGSDENAKKYAENINEIAETLDSSITIYSMVVPTHSTVSLDNLQTENAFNENTNIEIIKNTLSNGIKFIDVESALKNKKNEYIYYNTDENWTALGAYYAYKEFCENAELIAANLDGVEKLQIEDFFGGLFSSTKTDKNKDGNADLLKNPDTVEYYTFGNDYECGLWKTENSGESYVPFINEAVSTKNALDIFCYGDVSLFKVYTGKSTGKRLCIVKDSYGSEIAPYFTENYDEVHVIDARLFDGSLTGYCYNHSITDVLFINGVNTANEKEQIAALSDMS